MKQQLKRLNEEQKQIINENILKGVVSRASSLMFVWAFIISIYGFFSLDLFHTIIPELSLWDNVWPRLLYNTVPTLLFALWYRRYDINTKFKAYSTIIVLPLLLVAASMIHAWPKIFGGNLNFYLNFHATNIIALSSGLSILSATPRLVIFQSIGFLFLYFGPLLFLFSNKEPLIFNLILSDFTMISIILYFGLKATYRLRFFLAGEDLLRRMAASAFLGDTLTKAIYESTEMKFNGYTQDGLIMTLDLRGYTQFIQSYPSDVTKKFMNMFHSSATKIITKHGGYLHKTSGDGLLISFGVMEKDLDLSDIPGITHDESLASNSKKISCIHSAIKTFNELTSCIDILLNEYQMRTQLLVGCGLAYGPIDVVVRGDEQYRQELDIDGSAIVKATRLESYSKLFNNVIDNESSFLILDPSIVNYEYQKYGLREWLIQTKEQQVRDFPEIKSLLYFSLKHEKNLHLRNAS